jgi:TamB, inner membrane protein subunit of TAM complex
MRPRVPVLLAIALLGILLVLLFHDGLTAACLKSFARASGYYLRLSFLHVGFGDVVARDVFVANRAHEPLFTADRAEIAFSLRDLLPGSRRRFGLRFIDLQHPVLTMIHESDGAYDIALPSTSLNTASNSTPWDVRVSVREGEVLLRDRYIRVGEERLESITGVRLDGLFSQLTPSYYHAAFVLRDAGRDYPVWGHGIFGVSPGFMSQRWRAEELPIAALLNFALTTRTVRCDAGRLVDVNLRTFAFSDGARAFVSASARLENGQLYTAQLTQPIRDVRGSLHDFGNGIETTGLEARFAGVPLRLTGGVYGLRETPIVRFALRGAGDLKQLRQGAAAARGQPISGSFRVSAFIEGSARQPLVIARVFSPRLQYGQFAFARSRGTFVSYDTQLDVLGSDIAYGPFAFRARGSLDLREHVSTLFVGHAETLTANVPYLAQVTSDRRIETTWLLSGTDARSALQGVVYGSGNADTTRALFHMRPDKTGVFGPFMLRRGDENPVEGIAAFDFSGRRSLAFLDVSGLHPYGIPLRDVHAAVGVRGNTLDMYGASLRVADGTVTASGSVGGRGKLIVTAAGIDTAQLRALGIPWRQGRLSAVAEIQNLPRSPSVLFDVLLSHGVYAAAGMVLPFEGNVDLGYAGERVTVNAGMLLPGSYASLAGVVHGVRIGHLEPRADIYARVRAADIALLARGTRMRLSEPLEGSIDVDMHVTGKSDALLVDGSVRVPEGAFNGLRFRDGVASLLGSSRALTVRDGKIIVGGTSTLFAANVSAGSQSLDIHAAHVNLADFNDFFDVGDMLGGSGRISLDAVRSASALKLSGDLALSGTRVQSFSLGETSLRIRPAREEEEATFAVLGAHGTLRATGRFGFSPSDPIAVDAHINEFALGTWLPAVGMVTPLSGNVDASLSARGSLRAPMLAAHASLRDGFMGRIPIHRFLLDATADRQRVRISRASLDIPALNVTTSGMFSPVAGAPFAVTARAESLDIGMLAANVTGKKPPLGGTLIAQTWLSGTQTRPNVRAQVTLSDVRVNDVRIPRVFADAHLDARTASLDRGEIDLPRGKLLANGHVPIVLRASRFVDAREPLIASLTAAEVDLAPFARAFSSDTKLAGVLDGGVYATGTIGEPHLAGHIALRDALYSSSLLRSPIEHGSIVLDFHNAQEVRLSSMHLEAGGGRIDAEGIGNLGDLRHVVQTFAVRASAVAHNFRIDAPKYFRGMIDGTLMLVRAPRESTLVSGNVFFSQARIPLSDLIPSTPEARSNAPAPAIAFDLGVSAGNDVRVQNGNVDVGARGKVRLSGTLADPTLSGHFDATDGSFTFYRTFTVQSATVRFSPSLGLIPMVDATATTQVSDTDILLHATGQASSLNLDFASDPSYDREQIIALLAGMRTPDASAAGQPSFLQSTAFGYVNQQFARSFLEPLQSRLGQSLGLKNLQLNAGLAGTYGANATAALGRRLTASFAESYGVTQRQSVGLAERFNASTSVQFTLFSASASPQTAFVGNLPFDPTKPVDLSLLSLIPPAGTKGFTLSFQHRFR